MQESRYQPQVVKLQDGRILVMGGRGKDARILASSEIFDSRVNAWIAVGSMMSERYYHRATLASNGRVIVTGGINLSGPLASVEIFDPETYEWIPAAPMLSSRREHVAIEAQPGLIVVAGGGNPHVPRVTRTERLSLEDGQWREGSELPTGLANAAVSERLSDGSVFAIGGYADDGDASNTVQQFVPATSSWKLGVSTLVRRDYATVNMLPGPRLFLVGGVQDNGVVLGSSEFFNFDRKWVTGPSLNIPTWDHRALALPNGRLLVIGGITRGFATTARSEIYHPRVNSSRLASALHIPRYGAFAIRLNDGRIMVGGGASTYNAQGSTWLSSVEITCSAVN